MFLHIYDPFSIPCLAVTLVFLKMPMKFLLHLIYILCLTVIFILNVMYDVTMKNVILLPLCNYIIIPYDITIIKLHYHNIITLHYRALYVFFCKY